MNEFQSYLQYVIISNSPITIDDPKSEEETKDRSFGPILSKDGNEEGKKEEYGTNNNRHIIIGKRGGNYTIAP